MSVWSRIAETLASLHGGVVGFFDRLAGEKTPPERSVAFTIAMIALSAKMAKADGMATDDEYVAFSEVFQVPDAEKPAVTRLYNQAKQDIAGYESYANKVAKLFGTKSPILESVIDGLFHIAKADGTIHPGEVAYLEAVARIFGFDGGDWLRIRSRHVALQDDPFTVLGLAHDTSPDVIKKQYKALVKELHPDKQIAAGVPEEMVQLATERLARINAAYAQIERMGAV